MADFDPHQPADMNYNLNDGDEACPLDGDASCQDVTPTFASHVTSGHYVTLGVHAADLDGDGDADVLSASWWDSKVVWFENLGDSDEGDTPAPAVQVAIPSETSAVPTAFDVDYFGIDVDALDTLAVSSSGGADTIGTLFDARHADLASDDADGDGAADAEDAFPYDPGDWLDSDLDGLGDNADPDDDNDGVYGRQDECPLNPSLLCADNPNSFVEQVVAATGGGNFAASQTIATAVGGAASVHAGDLDGDGDADILSTSYRDSGVAWYANRGGEVFSAQNVISGNAPGAFNGVAADLDGDGDADVLSPHHDGKVAWHENLGSGDAWSEHAIARDADGAIAVYATDLNGDGYSDVVAASYFGGEFSWFRNLGGGRFTSKQVIGTASD